MVKVDVLLLVKWSKQNGGCNSCGQVVKTEWLIYNIHL